MKNRSGFTLMEIMIVVAIIGLLAAIAIPSLMRTRMANELKDLGYNSEEIGVLFKDYELDVIADIIDSQNIRFPVNAPPASPKRNQEVNTKNKAPRKMAVSQPDDNKLYDEIKLKDGETEQVGMSYFSLIVINDCQYIVTMSNGGTFTTHAGLCNNIKHRMDK